MPGLEGARVRTDRGASKNVEVFFPARGVIPIFKRKGSMFFFLGGVQT